MLRKAWIVNREWWIDARFTAHDSRHAFTLVELAIVIVVIGLIIGGVAVGQNLIKAGEVRSVSTDLQRYQGATQSFFEKYNSLPGDMNNATSYWGAAHATPATCRTTSSTTVLTCDGSGDNHIGENSTYYYEQFRYWQHLANAGLIEGSYSGVTGSGGTRHCSLGTNCPKSRIVGTGFTAAYYSTADASFLGAIKGNLLIYGKATSTNMTNGAALLAEDAWGIDVKIDDGLPGFGKLQQYSNATLANCITDATNYDLDSTTRGCAFIFELGL